MLTQFALFAASLVGAAQTAPGATPEDPSTEASAANKVLHNSTYPETERADRDKVVCRRVHETGWRVGKRKICMTQAEWDMQEEAAQDALRRKQSLEGKKFTGTVGN